MTRANPFDNPNLQECVVPGSAGDSSELLNSQDAEHHAGETPALAGGYFSNSPFKPRTHEPRQATA